MKKTEEESLQIIIEKDGMCGIKNCNGCFYFLNKNAFEPFYITCNISNIANVSTNISFRELKIKFAQKQIDILKCKKIKEILK